MSSDIQMEDIEDVDEDNVSECEDFQCNPVFLPCDIDYAIGVLTMDIYKSQVMLEDKFKIYNPDAKYLKWRRVLVDWMFDLGNEFGLNISTTHVAVQYLDRVLQDRKNVIRTQLQLVAMCCSLVAAKFEEAEDKVPSMDDLLSYAENISYTVYDMLDMERNILKRLEWNLASTTVLHCLDFFMAKGVMFDCDSIKDKPLPNKAPRYFKKYAVFFGEICLQNYDFQKYSTSLLASGMLAACRRSLYIKPLWRKELTELTGYSLDDIMPVYEHVWDHYMTSFPAESARRKTMGEDYSSPTYVGGI